MGADVEGADAEGADAGGAGLSPTGVAVCVVLGGENEPEDPFRRPAGVVLAEVAAFAAARGIELVDLTETPHARLPPPRIGYLLDQGASAPLFEAAQAQMRAAALRFLPPGVPPGSVRFSRSALCLVGEAPGLAAWVPPAGCGLEEFLGYLAGISPRLA